MSLENKNLSRNNLALSKQLSKLTWCIFILLYNHCLVSDIKIKDLVTVSYNYTVLPLNFLNLSIAS